MKKNTSRLLSALLALCMLLALVPGMAWAAPAEETLPDWYFLFAIFKNVDADATDQHNVETHITYTMTQDEVDIARQNAKDFEDYMNQFGLMRAHVDVVEIDETVTELKKSENNRSFVGAEQAAPLLERKGIDLDQYDHVSCIVDLNNLDTDFYGITVSPFENGTGHGCINFKNEEIAKSYYGSTRKHKTYVHEFLHFMGILGRKWGLRLDLHSTIDKFYNGAYDDIDCLTDIILNRVKGDAETETGVSPVLWRYPPRVLRTTSGLNVPDGVAGIADYAFRGFTNLESVTIPGSVTSIGKAAFYDCSNLKSVTIPGSVASIGYAAFWNTSITDVYYGGSKAQWKAIQFGEYNSSLTRCTIHYNSISVTVKGTPVTWTDAAPFIDSNSRTMVPLRAVADTMGLEVKWDGDAYEASFTDGSKTIWFPINKDTARTSDGTMKMDTAAVIVNGRTYAPIRYLAQYFGYTVGWDEATRTVSIK